MSKVSIICPVYNAENYIHRCVDSIIAQTYIDWECILVDDGSLDNSGVICDEYAHNDSRIKVIHKQNGGVSSARQAGLDMVSGEFVIHVDSDDHIAPNMMEDLLRCQMESDVDIVIFDFFRVKGGVCQYIRQEPKSLEHNSVLNEIICGSIYACCWNKLVKKSTIDKYQVKFPTGINFGEDKCFLASLLKNPISVDYLPKSLYYYDVSINVDSLVRQNSKSSIKNGMSMVAYLENNLSIEFDSSIYEVKRRIKIRAATSNLYNYSELINLYKEINKRLFLDVILLKRNTREDIMICLYLLGLRKIAHTIYKRIKK